LQSEPSSVSNQSPIQSYQSDVWEYADTHIHPYQGVLLDYQIKDGKLLTIMFKPIVALHTPTDPVGNLSFLKLGTSLQIPVRSDNEESSQMNTDQEKLLKMHKQFIIIIDDWVYGEKHFKGTTLKDIYFLSDQKYRSIKDKSLFDECGEKGCIETTLLNKK
jgi:hypothetical protein